MWLTGGQTVGKALFGLTERRIDGAKPKATLGGLAWAVGRHSWGYLVIDVLGVGRSRRWYLGGVDACMTLPSTPRLSTSAGTMPRKRGGRRGDVPSWTTSRRA